MRCYLSIGSVFFVLRGIYYIASHLCQKLGVAMTVTGGSEAETTADNNSKTMVYISFDEVSHFFELWWRNQEPKRQTNPRQHFQRLTLSILAGSLTCAHRKGNSIAENELPKSRRSCWVKNNSSSKSLIPFKNLVRTNSSRDFITFFFNCRKHYPLRNKLFIDLSLRDMWYNLTIIVFYGFALSFFGFVVSNIMFSCK